METLEGLKRTDYCGTLTAKDVGRTVTLCGWFSVSVTSAHSYL